MGEELVVGKSVGIDFHVFDKDADSSFTFSAWGKGEMKYVNPKSLGDVIILPANAKLASVSGKLSWDKEMKEQLPGQVVLSSVQHKELWLETAVDSSGNYSVSVPPGDIRDLLSGSFFYFWQ